MRYLYLGSSTVLFLLLPLLQLLANKTYNLEQDLLDLWDLERDLLLGPDLEQDLLDLEDLLDLGLRSICPPSIELLRILWRYILVSLFT